ncbi:MAG TPA: class II fructose-bisphosphate aldolase [Armatimonadota bacterium]|jgi:fructose-bisphosphate aldolase class II
MIDGLYTLQEILAPAQRHGFAVGAFTMWNAESLDAMLVAAHGESAPLIAMVGPMEIPLLGLRNFARLVRLLAADYDVPVCLHLDHSVHVETAREALEAGFPSVMLDFSDHAWEDNVAATLEVVALARARGAGVEAEIGHVGTADGSSNEVMTAESSLTTPEEAEAFVAATGVDALAVSVGTAHGLGQGLPELDFARLEAINERVNVPLVLHGGTGRGAGQVQRAVSLGIRKVNIASDLNRVFVHTMAEALEHGGGYFWHSTALRQMKEHLVPVVSEHLRVLGSSSRADLY